MRTVKHIINYSAQKRANTYYYYILYRTQSFRLVRLRESLSYPLLGVFFRECAAAAIPTHYLGVHIRDCSSSGRATKHTHNATESIQFAVVHAHLRGAFHGNLHFVVRENLREREKSVNL